LSRSSYLDKPFLRSGIAAGFLLLLLTLSQAARAEDSVKASELNAKAIEAYKAQRFIEAIDFWLQAVDFASKEQSVKLHKNIGLALHKLDRLPEAWYHLREYTRLAAGDDEQVKSAIQAIESTLGRTYLKATVVTSPPGATVVLPPGDRMHRIPSPAEWWLSPGIHEIELEKSGYETRKATITVAVGQMNSFAFELQVAEEEGWLSVTGGVTGSKVLVAGRVAGDMPFSASYVAGAYALEVVFPDGQSFKKVVEIKPGTTVTVDVPASLKAPIARPEGSAPPEKSHLWQWLSIGGGAALIGGGAVMMVLSGNASSDAESLIMDPKYDAYRKQTDLSLKEEYESEFNSLNDDFVTYYYTGVACFILGGGAVAAGTIGLLLDSGDEPAPSSASLAPVVGPDMSGLKLDITF
jgi:tetratricopeptide (TPR) repeat protein